MPSGWVDMHLTDGGATLELRCIDVTHKQHGEKHDLHRAMTDDVSFARTPRQAASQPIRPLTGAFFIQPGR